MKTEQEKAYERKWYHEHQDRCDAWHKKYYVKHKEEITRRALMHLKQTRASVRSQILELLGGKCVICGYVGVALQIDHVNGNGVQERKALSGRKHSGQISIYRTILQKLKYGSQDYQLLCANHNWEKRVQKNEHRAKAPTKRKDRSLDNFCADDCPTGTLTAPQNSLLPSCKIIHG